MSTKPNKDGIFFNKKQFLLWNLRLSEICFWRLHSVFDLFLIFLLNKQGSVVERLANVQQQAEKSFCDSFMVRFLYFWWIWYLKFQYFCYETAVMSSDMDTIDEDSCLIISISRTGYKWGSRCREANCRKGWRWLVQAVRWGVRFIFDENVNFIHFFIVFFFKSIHCVQIFYDILFWS